MVGAGVVMVFTHVGSLCCGRHRRRRLNKLSNGLLMN